MASAIKKIPVDQLKPGMYVHDLGLDWMSHPFLRQSFKVASADVDRIVEAGIRELYIDTGRGLDVAGAPTAEEVHAELDREMIAVATREPPRRKVALGEEMVRARQVHKEAERVVRSVMRDARLGRVIEIERIEPVVESITESIFRNPGALLSLCQIKTKDDYTFLHSVSVCTLMVAFCRHEGMSPADIREGGIGALLHDVGKVRVPDAVLTKPGSLTPDEFALIRRHPGDGLEILEQVPTIGEVPRMITVQHHERMDGSGYPHRLPGEAISLWGQMSAIVDVYDAISAERCYYKGLPPTEALRKIVEWSRFHFNPQLVHAFVRCIGIYPVGSLVRLESDRLAVVLEQGEKNLLEPTVRIFYDAKRREYHVPATLDLARPGRGRETDRIVGHEDPQRWGVDPRRFMDR